MRPACASLDADALRHNLQQIRKYAAARVMAIIKANGYGHGLIWVAKTLAEADGFGVASLEEGLELRAADVHQDISLLEGFFDEREIPLIIENQLVPVLHESHQIRALQRFRGQGPLDVWIKIDTGMHRLGFLPHELQRVVGDLQLPFIRRIGFLSHLAEAETPDRGRTLRQIEIFNDHTDNVSPRSLANSAAIIQWPESHADWVRPGLMLYGVSPLPHVSAKALNLRPVMTLRSELISVRRREQGDHIGYGADYRCPEDMTVGIVGLGYGDGYPREVSRDAFVLVRGHRAPLIGRVSMDMLNVDLRATPDAQVGDEVILWGAGLPVEDVARSAGTISYTLLCGLTQRIPRRGFV